MGRIREEYINTGKVRFVYKQFAILGSESNRAAEASECAAEQGKFWDYHDTVFADQVSTRSTLDDEKLTELAGETGLDATAFGECLGSDRYVSQIKQDSLVVQTLGVRVTPAFLINGVFISGAQPFEIFQQVIEEQLGDSSSSADQPAATPTQAEPSTSEDDIEGVEFFPDSGIEHQEGDIHYDENVPSGGTHSAAWQNCGIYDEPVPEEPVVHSLEHGAVWIAYQPDLPAEQVEILRDLVRQAQQEQGERLVLLAPQPGLETPIVATAWRVQLELDDASDERLSQFVSRYQNGSLAPEPEAPCTGSIGEPIE